VHLERALNTRDIGGYPTRSGETIKFGKIYRSSELSYLTNSDVEKIAALGLSHVVDFRGLREAAQAPDRLPDGVQVVPSPIIRDDLDFNKVHVFLDRNNFPPEMHDIERVAAYGPYHRMLTLVNSYDDPGYVDAVAGYKPLFQTLLKQPDDSAVLAHCTGGRDRTGVAMFFVMTLLGVPENLALRDYLASNVYLQPERDNPDSTLFKEFRFSNVFTQPPENKEFMRMAESLGTTSQAVYDSIRLRPEYPLSLMRNITVRYGSFAVFMKEAMGIGEEETREIKRKLLTA
jgi:protein-tyrosine phosphatase